ncbi:MAG: flagellar biosynthesis protein FliS, partial [Acidocella sp. 35-58-6]
LTGILETEEGSTLGPALMTIYAALRETLLRANINDDLVALDEYDIALATLDRQMLQSLESERAA